MRKITDDTITPMCYRTAESSTVKEGTYYITIRPFSADEQIEQNVILIVNKDPDTSGSDGYFKGNNHYDKWITIGRVHAG